MHHSSIKDHLTKNHPDKPHTTIEPGYNKKKLFFEKYYLNFSLVIFIILNLYQNLMNLIQLILIEKNLLNHNNNNNK